MQNSILVTNKANIRYLSGFDGTAGFVVLHKKKGFLFTDSRYHILAKSVLKKGFELMDSSGGMAKVLGEFVKKNKIPTLGFEGGDLSFAAVGKLKKALTEVSLEDIGAEVDERRMVKRASELETLRMAQTMTDAVFANLKKQLAVGMSEKDIAWLIESEAREAGADDISFPPIIGFNENAASPHHHCTDKKLKRGDLILIDMGLTINGYCSDMTRVLFTKQPTPEQTRVYTTVLAAQTKAEKALKAGVKGFAIDAIARDVIQKAGYGKNFGHSLGHGVGIEVHELPNLAPTYTGIISAGAVVTVEPGIYLEGKFGVRLEDMAIVGSRSAEVITSSPKAIQECLIQLK